RLRLGQKIVVVESPPGRGIAAKALALVPGVGARSRAHVEDSDLEDVARLGALDRYWSRADVHAQPLPGAPPEERRLYRAGPAPIDTLPVAVPVEHALGARVAPDHAVGVVVGMVREDLDRDVVARADLEPRREELAEVAPVHGPVVGGQVVMARRRRAHSRPTSCRNCRVLGSRGRSRISSGVPPSTMRPSA